ncbi:hypothetical protein [Hymenobacter persicinus]|uniref:Uncharacterized protein n=1 Tax=Hymenobacter persicinus TaxID=2025506 RepID=A0A4Q5LAR0_9BACT|nr:hypothetical protein [Hymenobacter persicinus]RYU79136.1 hypothetical protein EWM57_11425 [Hymenobacter persicinus]
MSAPPGTDFYSAKSDTELLFITQNAAYYHAELVQAARRELLRRGVAPDRLLPPAAPAPTFDEPVEAPARPWLRPVMGAGVAALALVTYLLWPAPAAAPPKPRPAPPAELVAVETHVLPSFEALTETQLRQMPAALPPASRPTPPPVANTCCWPAASGTPKISRPTSTTRCGPAGLPPPCRGRLT